MKLQYNFNLDRNSEHFVASHYSKCESNLVNLQNDEVDF